MAKFTVHMKPETQEELTDELPDGSAWGEYILECISLRKRVESRELALVESDSGTDKRHTIGFNDSELERALICIDSMKSTMDKAGDDTSANVFWSDVKTIIDRSEHDSIEDVAGLMVDLSGWKERVDTEPEM